MAKQKVYQNVVIEDFGKFFLELTRTYPNLIRQAEYDRNKSILTVDYYKDTTELTDDQIKNVQIPTILKFRKKLPKIDIPNATAITENEFIVETLDVETSRRKVKEKYPEFEEEVNQQNFQMIQKKEEAMK